MHTYETDDTGWKVWKEKCLGGHVELFRRELKSPRHCLRQWLSSLRSSELTAELQARLESLKRKGFRLPRRTFSQWSLQIHWVVRADNKARFWQMLTESHSAYLWLIHPIKNRSTPFALLWMPIMNGRACFHSSLSCPKHRLRRYLLCSMSNQAALKNLRVVVSPRILWK